jgi:holo-[acyl-carrier protein] synthase
MTLPFDIPYGGKVLGIGCDLAEVDRIQKAHGRHGQSFLNKVYTSAEQEYCLKQANPYPSLAARWAAKEAVAKAFTTGVSEHIGLLSIEITKGSRSEPQVKLLGRGLKLLEQFGGTGIMVSLSHTNSIAMAVAVVMK